MKRISTLILISFFLTACPSGADGDGFGDGGNYPEKAENLTIRLHEDGGMVPLGYSIFITQDSASWRMMRTGDETVISWKPTSEDIDKLYETLKDNKFDRIKSRDGGEVYDRGGTSIDIEINGKSIDLDNSGSMFVEDKWHDNFSAISEAIWRYANKEVDKQKIAVRVQFDDMLKNDGYPFTFNLNDVGIYHHEDSLAPVDTTLMFYPGYNDFYLQLFYKDSTTTYGGPVTYIWAGEHIEINANTTTVRINILEEEFDVLTEN